MTSNLSKERLNQALCLLSERLARKRRGSYSLVVCGGSALIATGLVPRTTEDVDIIALMDVREQLVDPDPLPEDLLATAREIAPVLSLMPEWLNNGPSRGGGGLYRMGLPRGLVARLSRELFGSNLTVYWIDRLDQIHFKVYAAVDRGGYHVADLKELNPSTGELILAGRWSMTHDVSPAFRQQLISMLEQLGYEDAAFEL